MIHACYLAVGKDKTAKQVRQSSNRGTIYSCYLRPLNTCPWPTPLGVCGKNITAFPLIIDNVY